MLCLLFYSKSLCAFFISFFQIHSFLRSSKNPRRRMCASVAANNYSINRPPFLDPLPPGLFAPSSSSSSSSGTAGPRTHRLPFCVSSTSAFELRRTRVPATNKPQKTSTADSTPVFSSSPLVRKPGMLPVLSEESLYSYPVAFGGGDVQRSSTHLPVSMEHQRSNAQSPPLMKRGEERLLRAQGAAATATTTSSHPYSDSFQPEHPYTPFSSPQGAKPLSESCVSLSSSSSESSFAETSPEKGGDGSRGGAGGGGGGGGRGGGGQCRVLPPLDLASPLSSTLRDHRGSGQGSSTGASDPARVLFTAKELEDAIQVVVQSLVTCKHMKDDQLFGVLVSAELRNFAYKVAHLQNTRARRDDLSISSSSFSSSSSSSSSHARTEVAVTQSHSSKIPKTPTFDPMTIQHMISGYMQEREEDFVPS